MLATTEDLLQHIRLGEDSVLELKTVSFRGDTITGPHRDGMADELAAMANTSDGVIVLDVDDKTRNIVGIPLDKLDLVESWPSGIRNDSIEPPLTCVILARNAPRSQPGQDAPPCQLVG